MMRAFLACLLVVSLAYSQARTTISDTLYGADGTLASGRMEISWPALKSADNFTIAKGRLNYTLTNGVVNLALVPNAGATPAGTTYEVTYFLGATRYTENWTVPSTGPTTVRAIRTTPVPIPVVTFGEHQLTLGTGMGDVLQLWMRATDPPAPASGEGHLYWNTTDNVIKAWDGGAWLAGSGSDPTRVLKAGDTMSGSLLASTTAVNLGSLANPFGAIYQDKTNGVTRTTTSTTSDSQDLLSIAGLGGTDPNERRAINWTFYPDAESSNPNFSNQSGLFANLWNYRGQYDVDGVAKKTFAILNLRGHHYGSGQRFVYTTLNNCYGIGDCGTSSDTLNSWAGTHPGDEGTFFRTMNLNQGPSKALTTISSVPAQTGCNTTTTQARTKDIAPQPVTVASTTGCAVGDWITVDRGPAYNGDEKLEGVKLTAVGGGALTGIFKHDHLSGATITPATKLTLASVYQMGEWRYLVNLSGSSYAVGTVSSFAGRVFTFSGTSFTAGMVGGDATLAGCVSFDQDTYSGNPFAASPLRAWYPIQSVDSATQLTIGHRTVVGGVAYKGLASSGGAYIIRPCARILAFDNSSPSSLSTTVVLERNTFTWTATNSVEAVHSTNEDVSGELMRVAWYLPGSELRGVYTAMNMGSQTFGAAFRAVSAMTAAGLKAWESGVSLEDRMTQGISISGYTTGSAILMATPTDASDAKDVKWTGGHFLGPNPADTPSLRIQGCTSCAGGLLSWNGNIGSGYSTMTHVGHLKLRTLSGASESPKVTLESGQAGSGTWELRHLVTGTVFSTSGHNALEWHNNLGINRVLWAFGNFGMAGLNSKAAATGTAGENSYALGFRSETWAPGAVPRYTLVSARPDAGTYPAGDVPPMTFRVAQSNSDNDGVSTEYFGARSDGTLRWRPIHTGATHSNFGILAMATLTTLRTWTFPDVTGTVALTSSNVATATALAADPTDCGANNYATAIAASGNLTCAQVAFSQLSGTADAIGPTQIDETANYTWTGTHVYTSGKVRVPNGTALPGTCTVGDSFMDTDATLGQQWYLCTSTNTWTLQGDGTGGGASHNLLSSTHSDTTAASGVRGDLIVRDATAWARLAIGAANRFLGSDGTDAAWTAPTGGGTVLGTGRTLTGGAGIAVLGDLSADRTVATASGEADFLASGALTCGAGTQGKMQVHTTPLQYCDNAGTPGLRYAADGDSGGAALTGDSATGFFGAGALEKARQHAATVYNDGANTWSTGLQDFGAATLKIPNAATLPGTCAVGEIYADNNETPAGQQVYFCSAANVWSKIGDGGGGGGITSLASQTGATQTITRGAGIGGASAANDHSFATASGEADFLASGALTCGAGTQGKMQVHTTPLQYCDNAGTPALRYAADGDSGGAAKELAGLSGTNVVLRTGAAAFTAVGTNTTAIPMVLTQKSSETPSYKRWCDADASLCWRDDFLYAHGTTPTGWTLFTTGTGALSNIAVAGRPGVVRLSSGTTVSSKAVLANGTGASANTVFDVAENFDITWKARTSVTGATKADHLLCLNADTSSSTNLPLTDGYCVEVLSADSPYNWYVVNRRASSASRYDTGSAVTNGTWYSLRLYRVDGNTIGLSVGGGSTYCITSAGSLPGACTAGNTSITMLTGNVRIWWEVRNNTAATAETLDVDVVELYITGLSRS